MEDQIKQLNKMHNQLRQRINIMNENIKSIDDLAIKNNIEVWRKIKDYLNYSVSSFGKVRNDKSNRMLKLTKRDGYYRIDLHKKKAKQSFAIHRLVAMTFIDNKHNKPFVDHQNNNKTDNNVKNLRFVTNQENSFNASLSKSNTSGVKGVIYNKRDRKWEARIYLNGKQHFIGNYKTLEEAKSARSKKAQKLFGEYINACEI